MKVILPVAGYATRLYPLTENTPKALLPVGGKPMLDIIMRKISAVDDIDEVIIVSNDKFTQQFVRWASTCMSDKDIHVINDGTKSNEDRLGSLGDIALALRQRNINEDILVIAGDNLFGFSLTDFVTFARQKNTSTIAVYDVRDLEYAKQFGIVSLNTSQIITSFVEKPQQPTSSLAATMCYYLKKEDLALIDTYLTEGNKPDRAGDFLTWLVKKKQVHAYTFPDYWHDIGTREQYTAVCEKFTMNNLLEDINKA